MWMTVKSTEQFKEEYQVQQVLFIDDMEVYIKSLSLKKIFLYYAVDSDSGLEVAIP